MPRLLIVAKQDLTAELGRTVLWRGNVHRESLHDLERTVQVVSKLLPDLVIIDDVELQRVIPVVHQLRESEDSRHTGIAVLVREDVEASAQRALFDAGVNIILPVPVEPLLKALVNWGRIDGMAHGICLPG